MFAKEKAYPLLPWGAVLTGGMHSTLTLNPALGLPHLTAANHSHPQQMLLPGLKVSNWTLTSCQLKVTSGRMISSFIRNSTFQNCFVQN